MAAVFCFLEALLEFHCLTTFLGNQGAQIELFWPDTLWGKLVIHRALGDHVYLTALAIERLIVVKNFTELLSTSLF